MATAHTPANPLPDQNVQPQGNIPYLQAAALADEIVDSLTEREVAVWKLIAEGETTKDIARKLGIAFKTAVSHRTNLMSKLGMHDVATLTRYAIRRRVILP